MNICFLLDHFTSGGIGRVTALIGNGLAECSLHRIYALCFARNGREDVYETHFPVTYIYNHCKKMTTALLFQRYLSKVRRFAAANKIDIIIACGVEFYPIAIAAAAFRNVKVICWEHTDPNQTGEYLLEKQRRIIGALFSDRNVTLTKDALEVYNSRFPRKRNIQIYNPIDPLLLQTTGNYQSQSKKIISVGRLCYPKNYDRLLKISAVVLPKHPDWQWDIYGDGVLRQEIEQLIIEMGLQNRVFLKGQCANIYEKYREYAFLVMTSRYEGFPMTLLEGAANRLPLIAFDVPTGPSEIITDGKNGFLCSSDSDAEMIQAIETMISDQKLRERFSIESRATAEAFSMDRILPQWQALFDELSGAEM